MAEAIERTTAHASLGDLPPSEDFAVNAPEFLIFDWHKYEGWLQTRRPQSNGFVERLHRTLLDKHFRIQGRQKWYESVEEMQTDLDEYFHHYNHNRPHQGRNMNGLTPYTVFLEGLFPSKESEADEDMEAA